MQAMARGAADMGNFAALHHGWVDFGLAARELAVHITTLTMTTYANANIIAQS